MSCCLALFAAPFTTVLQAGFLAKKAVSLAWIAASASLATDHAIGRPASFDTCKSTGRVSTSGGRYDSFYLGRYKFRTTTTGAAEIGNHSQKSKAAVPASWRVFLGLRRAHTLRQNGASALRDLHPAFPASARHGVHHRLLPRQDGLVRRRYFVLRRDGRVPAAQLGEGVSSPGRPAIAHRSSERCMSWNPCHQSQMCMTEGYEPCS